MPHGPEPMYNARDGAGDGVGAGRDDQNDNEGFVPCRTDQHERANNNNLCVVYGTFQHVLVTTPPAALPSRLHATLILLLTGSTQIMLLAAKSLSN